MSMTSRRDHLLALLGGIVLLLLLGRRADFTVSAGPPRPTPTPLPSSLDQAEVAPEGVGDKFPDLIVEDIAVVPTMGAMDETMVVLVDAEVEIRVTIRNQSERAVAVGNNFYVDLYVDPEAPPTPGTPGDLWWGVQGEWMAAGASYVLVTTWVFTDTRTYHLYAQVDTDCSVIETDEYNNIEGPVEVWVRTARCFRQDSHPDFQYGFSNLDISHPDGVLYLGAYSVSAPIDSVGGTPALDHRPDVMVNDITYPLPFTTTFITDTARQQAPAMVNGGGDVLYIAWEDGRNGELYNRDIYFASSLNGGESWSQDIRVNQDPITATANQSSPALAFDPASFTLYAMWQDNRAGDYDIYLARSTDGGQTWEEAGGNPINDDGGDADQLDPSLAIGDDGTVYAVWQDERNGNSDIYFSQSRDRGETWSRNALVTDDPESTEQRQTSPSIIAHGEKIYVVWEDERNVLIGDPADIYFVWGKPCHDPECDNPSFDVDRRVNNDAPGAEQRQPVLAAHDVTIYISRTETIPDPVIPTQTIEVECYDVYEGTALHFAWQDYRAGPDDPDIYYAWTSADFDYPSTTCLHPLEVALDNPMGIEDYEIAKNEEVNDRSLYMGYCLPPDHEQPRIDYCDHPQDECWGCYEGASWQGHPAMLAKGDGVFIAWSDGRVFDDYWNYNIWVASTYWDPDPEDYVISGNVVVNDNAKLYPYLNAERYTEYGPASVRQDRPTLALCDDCSLPYVAWDDNRRADPLAGCPGNRDIYFARPGMLPTGIYLSPVFDAGFERATWYILDWWGVTPHGTNLTLQTRMGNTPWPDEHWSQWTGLHEQNGEWVYDAPGQHIVDEHGNPFPLSRYLQYRVNLVSCPTCAPCASPCLSRVTLYYERPYTIFLPLTLKSYAP